MQWIDVKDKLPLDNERVIISCNEGICTARLLDEYWQMDPIGSYATDGCIFDITHWMPLPEPPKENPETHL